MDNDRYVVRPFTDADFEPWSRLVSLFNPDDPTTAEEERAFDQTFTAPHLFRKKWAVDERNTGLPVGFGVLAHSPHQYHPHKFWTMVLVDPAHRGRGVGRTLCALIDQEAVGLRAECFWVSLPRDDARGIRFALQQGFHELRRLWQSSLDLAQAKKPAATGRTTSLAREGIRFTTLAAEGPGVPDVRRRLFEMYEEAARDIPRLGEYSPISFDQFVAVAIEGPVAFPEGIFLASDGEAYVAVSTLELNPARPDSLRVGFTGTRAAYRGRGIATELKRRALEYAQSKGYRYLWTMNDSLNDPIWAINQQQGFRRAVEWSSQERTISSAAPAATGPT